MLRLLAACRTEVDAACWGVFALQPNEGAGHHCGEGHGGAGLLPAAPTATPTHADLLALECGVVPAASTTTTLTLILALTLTLTR